MRGPLVATALAVAFVASASSASAPKPRRPLGERLFQDATLSLDGSLSCASCHDPKTGFSDTRPKPTGVTGKALGRKTPTLLGLSGATLAGWTGKFSSLEEVSCFALAVPMGTDATALRRRLGAKYGGELGGRDPLSGACSALAAYVRGLRTPPSGYDLFLAGDATALGAAADRGRATFLGKGECSSCHAGPDLTDGAFHDVGAGPEEDLGRGAAFPGSRALAHAHKTPSLRDVALRSPYMHDGSVATLAEVVAGYDRGGMVRAGASIRPLGLTKGERDDLVAFLGTLSGR